MPTLKAVGNVIGIEVASRSKNSINICKLVCPLYRNGYKIAKTTKVNAVIMYMKYIDYFVKLSIGFF